jgi:hypothetical protein
MSFQITSRIAAVFQEFTLVFLFFTSLLLHHNMDLRLARARHFGHVCFHLVTITLPSRWRQRRPTRRLPIKPGTDVFYHQGSGTASQATPRGRHRIRSGVGYHSVAYSTSVTSLELGESYAGPENATQAAEALMRLRHLSRRTHVCCGTELVSESELESESEMPFRFRR